MAKEDKQRKSKLEKTKKSLYDKYADLTPKERSELQSHRDNAKHEWEDGSSKQQKKKKQKKKPSSALKLTKAFLVVAVMFFIGAGIFAGLNLFQGSNIVSTDSVEMDIVTKPFVDGGEEFNVTVEVTNNNPTALELADLILAHPTARSGEQEMREKRVSLGTIPSGETVMHDFSIQLYGTEGDTKKISSELEYRVANSNAIFVTETSEKIGIRSTPVNVLVSAPDSAVPGQPYEFDIEVQSNSSDLASDLLLALDYPQGFTFTEAEPQPAFDDNTWKIGDIPPGDKRTITVRGKLDGSPGANTTFRTQIGGTSENNTEKIGTLFAKKKHNVSLSPSFIQANLLVNGQNNEQPVISNSSRTDLTINWQNTMPTLLEDVKLTGSLSGNAFNSQYVLGGSGFFDSNTNKVTWDGTNNEGFDQVNPGNGGELIMRLDAIPLVESGDTPITNPHMNFSLNAKATLPGGDTKQVQNIVDKEIRINSNVQIEQGTLYHEGPFQNSGPMPPSVGQTTDYTLSWKVSNTSNKLTEAQITTQLPSYVTWVELTSPQNETVKYNKVDNTLTWDIGTITAGAGFTSQPRRVYMQVSITPSAAQEEEVPALTDSVVFNATDAYTDETLEVVKQGHTTRLLNDISTEPGRVQK